MNVHPNTGLKYKIVIPDVSGPYVDIRLGYEQAALTRPWMDIITPYAFAEARQSDEWLDSKICYVLWGGFDQVGFRSSRKAKVIEVYAEAIGAEHRMIPDHISHRTRFRERAEQLDAVFVHTPRMAEYMRANSLNARVVPVGWVPETCNPKLRIRKDRRSLYAFWGSMIGIRLTAVPRLEPLLGNKLASFTGLYGHDLVRKLSLSRAALYVPHSEVWSFSTWRIWQSVAAGTPMVIPRTLDGEKLDFWPMEHGQFVETPWAYGDSGWSADEAAKDLLKILDSDELQLARSNMIDGLSERFRIDRVIDEWLVPACADVKGPYE